jgi:hypothetical protein
MRSTLIIVTWANASLLFKNQLVDAPTSLSPGAVSHA